MTNKEAIVYLEGQWDCMCSEDCQIYTGHKDCPQGFICTDGQALLTAISALQAQEAKTQLSAEGTTSDLISRQDAIEAMSESLKRVFPEHRQIAEKCLNVLPSAQPEPCEDAVSREAAIDAALSAFSRGLLASPDIRKLPSVQPERKTGRWLIREGISDAQCSECGMYFNDVYDMDNSDAFCRHCGAKMEGLKVVEDE